MSARAIAVALTVLAAPAFASPNGIGAPSGKRTGPMTPPPAPISALALGPKQEHALVGDARGRVLSYSLLPLKGALLGTLPGAVTGLAWRGNSRAAIADDGSVAWIGTSVTVVGRHGTGAQALALTAEGLLFTGGDDGTIRIWKPGALHSEPKPLAAHDGPVTGLALSGKYLLSVGWDGQLRSWKLPRARATRPRLKKHKRYRAGSREMTALVVVGERVVTACFDGELVVWTWEKRRYVPKRLTQRTHQEWVCSLTAGPAGKFVIGVAPAEQGLLIVEPGGGAPSLLDQAQPPAVAAVLPRGRALIGRFDGTLDVIPVPALGGGK